MTRPTLRPLINIINTIIVRHNNPLRLRLARSNISNMMTALYNSNLKPTISIPAAFRHRCWWADADGTHRPVAALIQPGAVEFLDLLVFHPLVVEQDALAGGVPARDDFAARARADGGAAMREGRHGHCWARFVLQYFVEQRRQGQIRAGVWGDADGRLAGWL
jgi:hypothetical protein